MKALSLTTPWPFAILRCGKRIENRLAWKSCHYRGLVALHASNPPSTVLSWWRRVQVEPGYQGTERQREDLFEWRDEVRLWAERAKLDGLKDPGPVSLRDLLAMTGHIVGIARIVGVVYPNGNVLDSRDVLYGRALRDSERRWWMGGFALVLDEVRELPTPIPCKGALGLWTVPDDVANRIGVLSPKEGPQHDR